MVLPHQAVTRRQVPVEDEGWGEFKGSLYGYVDVCCAVGLVAGSGFIVDVVLYFLLSPLCFLSGIFSMSICGVSSWVHCMGV